MKMDHKNPSSSPTSHRNHAFTIAVVTFTVFTPSPSQSSSLSPIVAKAFAAATALVFGGATLTIGLAVSQLELHTLRSHIPLTKVLAEKIGNYVDQYVEAMEKVKLKQGLKIAMSISGEGNAYLQESRFWKLYKENLPLFGIRFCIRNFAIPAVGMAFPGYVCFWSLNNDMNGMTDMYRANAICNLCRIIDGTLLTQIERHTRYSLATSTTKRLENCKIMKRWSNEEQELLSQLALLIRFRLSKGSDDYDQTEEPKDYVEAQDDV
ncbi:probable methionine--tRNA ligase [Tanacetum coccineum]